MARLKGVPPFVGTVDGVTVFKRWENYYIRAKSTLSGERVRTALEFKKTMENASCLARASKIASGVYQKFPEKNFQLYRTLTGQAMRMLKSGMGEQEVIQELDKTYGTM